MSDEQGTAAVADAERQSHARAVRGEFVERRDVQVDAKIAAIVRVALPDARFEGSALQPGMHVHLGCAHLRRVRIQPVFVTTMHPSIVWCARCLPLTRATTCDVCGNHETVVPVEIQIQEMSIAATACPACAPIG